MDASTAYDQPTRERARVKLPHLITNNQGAAGDTPKDDRLVSETLLKPSSRLVQHQRVIADQKNRVGVFEWNMRRWRCQPAPRPLRGRFRMSHG